MRAGQRVAMSDLTFWATYEAIVAIGAEPVLIDVDASLHLSFDELQRAHAQEPVAAVLLPQLFGWCSPSTDAIRGFCETESIALVEDSAQAFGVAREGV